MQDNVKLQAMMQQHEIDKKADETLDSLEGIQRATPAPYFFTRLQARLQEKIPLWENISIMLNRPAVAFATISFVLVLNAFVFLKQQSHHDADTVSAPPVAVEMNEQNMTNVYDFASNTNNTLLKIWNTENEQVKK